MDKNIAKELQKIEAQLASLDAVSFEDDMVVLLREKLRESFYLFVRLAWSEVDSSKFIDGFYIEAICEHLEALYTGEIRNLLINVPPRHAKSTLCSVLFPVWVWLKEPSTQFLCASYNVNLSVRDAVKSRTLMSNTWFQNHFGAEFQLSYDNNKKEYYTNNLGGLRISTSVGGSGTGFGYDICSIDDPHKANDVNSKVKLENAIEWFSGTMSTRANNPQTSRMMVIMQRLSKGDLSQYLIDSGEFELLKLPMEYVPTNHVTSIGWRDPRTIPGELLSPNRYSKTEVEKLKKSLSVGGYGLASAQLQQNPIPVEGRLINVNSFNWYFPYFVNSYQIVISSWDLATGLITGDYSVGQVWGYTEGKYYLLDSYRSQEPFDKQLLAFEALNKKWNCQINLIEKHTNAQALYDLMKRKYNNIKLLEPREFGGSKEARFLSIYHLIKNNQVFLPKNALFVDTFLSELLEFPRSKYDDQVDSCAYALAYLDKYYDHQRNNSCIDPDLLEKIIATGETLQDKTNFSFMQEKVFENPTIKLFEANELDTRNLW